MQNPHAVQFGSPFPAVDYDRVLETFSRCLMSRPRDKTNRERIVDVHDALSSSLRVRRSTRASFSLTTDGFSPSETGSWLIAAQLLKAWHVPGTVAVAEIDAANKKVTGGDIRNVVFPDPNTTPDLSFIWRTLVPMAFDKECDAQCLKTERTAEVGSGLNAHRLRISGLGDRTYRLHCEYVYKNNSFAGDYPRLLSGQELRDLDPTFRTSA